MDESLPFRIRLDGKQTLDSFFEGHHPVRISNICNDDPSAIFLRKLLKNDSAILLEGVKSWMWVPLINKDKFIAIIGIARTDGNNFTQHEADLAMTIANMAAVALVNAELV